MIDDRSVVDREDEAAKEWVVHPRRRLLSVYAVHWRQLLVGTLLMLVSSVTALASPFVIRGAVSAVLLEDSPHVRDSVILSACLIVLSLSTGYFGRLAIAIAGELSSLQLRNVVTQHVIRLPLDYFRRFQTGYIMSRIGEVGAFGEDLLQAAFQYAQNSVMSIVCLALIGYHMPRGRPQDVFASFALCSPVFIAGFLLANRAKHYNKIKLENWAKYERSLKDMISSTVTIRSFSAETSQFDRVAEAASEGTRSSIDLAKLSAVARVAIGVTALIVPIIGLALGGAQAMKRDLSFPDFVTLLVLLGIVATSSRSAFVGYLNLRKTAGNFDRIREMMGQKTQEVPEHGEPVPLTQAERAVLQLEAVCMCYQGRDLLFENVNLAIYPRQKVGLVGPNGAGKSTLFGLLLGLEHPTAGRIFVNGADVRGIQPLALRKFISIVPQDPSLLTGTIRENLLLGTETMDLGALENAVREVGLDGLIARLPDGLDTQVGENGRELSHGERKRIAVARCILRRPAVVLLDEATESLDEAYQKLIPELIDREFADTVVIRSSHRPEDLETCEVLYEIRNKTICRLDDDRNTGHAMSRSRGALK